MAVAKEGTFTVWVDADLCKGTEGCALCLAVCEEEVLGAADRMTGRGIHPIEVTAPANCSGCGLCVLHCPDLAIWLSSQVAEVA